MARSKRDQGRYIYKDCPLGLNEEAYLDIRRYRLQMLIHSYIYYALNENILTDVEFDRRAYKLVELQSDYPEESKACDLYEFFNTWDGTTGFDLPRLPFIEILARRTLEMNKEYGRG